MNGGRAVVKHLTGVEIAPLGWRSVQLMYAEVKDLIEAFESGKMDAQKVAEELSNRGKIKRILGIAQGTWGMGIGLLMSALIFRWVYEPVPNELVAMLEISGIAAMLYGLHFNFKEYFGFHALAPRPQGRLATSA
ncbi:MAG: hypothetical protein A2992_02465 [Elusimicrobia bacterium RIFCSPLOWO2_01_FULL_59_12]|nr:MAG: hypothetical protein A2992_02465 [Elusimicrobia bacterium RIFCSPLOWO2_01_FULL_59_12]